MFADLLEVLSLAGLSTAAVVLYLIFVRKPSVKRGPYNDPGWNYPLKLLWARYAVRKWKPTLSEMELVEKPQKNLSDGWDGVVVRASAPEGTLMLGIRKLCDRKPLVEVIVFVKLSDGTTYRLPKHPDTAIGSWEDVEDGWSAGGLKIHVIEPSRLRIHFNGLLTKDDDKTIHHVKLNFIWTSATSPIRFPHDWSNQLAAQALALEPWRDGDWSNMLNKLENRSWLQWGSIQGRFQAYDDNAAPGKTEYLRLRGVRERSWTATGYKGLRRSIKLIASASDGTAVHVRALSYKNNFTQCLAGCVRFPDFSIESITSTDLVMEDFCETPNEMPRVYTINVSTKKRSVRMVLRLKHEEGELFSGVPRRQRTLFRTVQADIDGRHGTGIVELGYKIPEKEQLVPRLSPPRYLNWRLYMDTVFNSYCLPFEDRDAACAEIFGGKGASLALLASVQDDEGYHVPPGFCIAASALRKQINNNPELSQAVLKLHAANEDYQESRFRELCTDIMVLLVSSELISSVKQEVLQQLKDLRQKAADQGFGTDIRFAVRSSAVGEDSEALSAAGQNETILGCRDDEQVLSAILKCWASMYDFTSTYYRRQNGQLCMCDGAVVVQVMAEPRAAGVMFTRHPAAGHPGLMLITANYGLGESVVSGKVEPDTIVIKRNGDELTIAKIEIGSKAQRVTSANEGVTTESVLEEERAVACLSESEIMKLARIGASQDDLWGAGRDIEWALGKKGEIYLLQARPITSLERWTEEELLHEIDSPIMADDELITFANTGEVLPRPISPLSFDLVNTPLEWGVYQTVKCNGDGYDKTLAFTHYRLAMFLYNSVYRRVPPKIDVGVRMLDMNIHGHKVATDEIIATALRRRTASFIERSLLMLRMIKLTFTSKRTLKDCIKLVENFNIDVNTNDPLELLNRLLYAQPIMQNGALYHNHTSGASSFTQMLAMGVLLEGQQDFTLEQCNEIGTLLRSGDVLSAEVPKELGKLSRQIQESGRMEEFRAQDPKKALNWLEQNLPEVHKNVRQFLDQHGYRAIMEFDLSTKPWVLVPEELMSILAQMRLTQDTTEEQVQTDDEIINSLVTPQKSRTRKMLSWILPYCRQAVRHREGTKANLILAVHKLRLAAIRLGHLLVKQWYIPNPDLVFFFRARELRIYILTRDPTLLRKAIQRQQYYNGWSKLKFAELYTGWVEPLKVLGPQITSGDVKIQATPACGGEVVARACVVRDLSEIGELQQGDILITHSTDIGWSPYFPLLSGIVTELGGLISHGAVIAREYGLPCVVGAASATELFKTGDTVRLIGNNGTVEKVQVAK